MPARYALALSLGVFAVAVQAQSRLYCCTDATGRRVCGDILPQACYDRTYQELTPGGRLLREVELLTPAQRAQREATVKAQQERATREAEARRRDQVLLDTYANVSEIDRRRDRELGDMEAELQRARAREADLQRQHAKLDKLKPASGVIPKGLADNLATVAGEIEAIRSVIESKQRDIDVIRGRFDADRKRFLELTRAATPAGQ